jgi:uncharacterized DUF497 family protein
MGLIFEWDEDKEDANLRKHGLSFEEAKRSSLILWPSRLQTQTTPEASAGT